MSESSKGPAVLRPALMEYAGVCFPLGGICGSVGVGVLGEDVRALVGDDARSAWGV